MTAKRDSKPGLSTMDRVSYAGNLPEWEMFPTEADRKQALDEIGRSMTPRSIGSLFWFLLIVCAVIFPCLWLAGVLFDLIHQRWPLPHLGLWKLGLGTLMYIGVITLLIRRDMPKTLRKKLLRCGVPVCLKCGYDLRGHSLDRSDRCPECGRAFSGRVQHLLAEQSAGGRAIEE